MSNFLQKIQSLPEYKKKRIWVLSTVLITAVIFFGWLSTLKSDFLAVDDGSKSSNSNVASPIGALGDTFSGFWNDLKTDFDELKGNLGF
jgi:hypothetical protein